MSLDDEQQMSCMKTVNDKLLHKYVAEVTDAKWRYVVNSSTIPLIFFLLLGVFAYDKIGLSLPVIAVYCAFWLCSGVCDTIIAYPLSRSRIAKTPTAALRQTLLDFCWRDKVATAIRLPIFMGLSIWLAFELRHAFNYNIIGFEISNHTANVVFWAALIIPIVAIVDAVLNTYVFTPKKIDGLVREIDELSCNNIYA